MTKKERRKHVMDMYKHYHALCTKLLKEANKLTEEIELEEMENDKF